jgi:hypothetical protein
VRINGKKFEDLKDEDDGTFSQPGSRQGWFFLSFFFSNLDREVEPFDEALDRETWSLYNQRLQWDLELATKRRKRPREVSDLLENLFKVQDAALGELDKAVEEDEDRPDASLPDGQSVRSTRWPVADILRAEGTLAETSDTFSKVTALSEGLHQVRFPLAIPTGPES